MNIISKIVSKWEFNRLKATHKTRQQLRDYKFIVDGKPMNAMKYIDMVASRLPVMRKNGIPVSHVELLRKYYYKFDLPGIQFYLNMIKRVKTAEPVAETTGNNNSKNQ